MTDFIGDRPWAEIVERSGQEQDELPPSNPLGEVAGAGYHTTPSHSLDEIYSWGRDEGPATSPFCVE